MKKTIPYRYLFFAIYIIEIHKYFIPEYIINTIKIYKIIKLYYIYLYIMRNGIRSINFKIYVLVPNHFYIFYFM